MPQAIPYLYGLKKWEEIDLSQDRRHNEIYADENEAVAYRL